MISSIQRIWRISNGWRSTCLPGSACCPHALATPSRPAPRRTTYGGLGEQHFLHIPGLPAFDVSEIGTTIGGWGDDPQPDVQQPDLQPESGSRPGQGLSAPLPAPTLPDEAQRRPHLRKLVKTAGSCRASRRPPDAQSLGRRLAPLRSLARTARGRSAAPGRRQDRPLHR
jgi:hypothetical protein